MPLPIEDILVDEQDVDKDELREFLEVFKSASHYATLALAVTAAAGGTLRIDTSVAVAANTTVPSTVTLKFERGGKLVPAASVTVTINGPIEAQPHQIFDLAAAGSAIAGFGLVERMLPEWWGVTGDGTTNDTAAFVKAVAAAIAASKCLHLRGVTYSANLSIRGNNTGIVGPGSSVCTIKHPNVALSNVLELGDTASGNGAVAYSKIVVKGVTLDGNRSVVAAPANDLVGHGLILTKISHYEIEDVRAVDCHNGGIVPAINSNYGKIRGYVENCGNATHTAPGFDCNSSKHSHFVIVSKSSYVGGRLLDNCEGVDFTIVVDSPTLAGVIYENQATNRSRNNRIKALVRNAGDNSFALGKNCFGGSIELTSYGAGNRGFQEEVQAKASHTVNAEDSGVVSTANDTIAITAHGWTTGYEVEYTDNGGSAIGGLTSGTRYFVIRVDNNTIKLATTSDNASDGSPINLTALGTGTTHKLMSDLSSRGIDITTTTERSANAGVFLGGDDHTLRAISNLDGRGGAAGDSFALDINGKRPTLLAPKVIDSEEWHVRGIAIRATCEDAKVIGYTYRNTLNPWSDAGSNTFRDTPLTGSATYDPGSLADGAGVTTTVPVANAALGDRAAATFSLDLQGITVTAWVSAADTVSVRLQNESGGTLDLASGTLKAFAWRG